MTAAIEALVANLAVCPRGISRMRHRRTIDCSTSGKRGDAGATAGCGSGGPGSSSCKIAAVRLTVSTKLGHPGSLLPARGPPARRADASSVSPDQATGRGKGQSAAQGPDSTAGGATTLSCFGRPRTIAVQSWAPVAARFLRPSASARCRQLTANDPQAQRQTDRRSHCDGDQGQGGTAEDRADRHEK